MKLTVKDLVVANKSALLQAGTSTEIRALAKSLGILGETDAQARARWGKFTAALKEVCDIDYYAVRDARREQNQIAAEQAVAGEPLHIIYVDAARKGYAPVKIGMIVLDESETEIARKTAFNSNCTSINGDHDQFAAECYGVLKAVEIAKEMNLKRVEIRNDRISSFTASTKRDYCGAKYLWIAKKIASESGILVTFSHVSGQDNIADGLSRSSAVYATATTPAERALTAAPAPVTVAPAPQAVEKSSVFPPETVAAAEAQPSSPARSVRGPEFQAWFEMMGAEWPKLRDAWKAEGLSSRERDIKLNDTVAAWAKTREVARA